MTYTLRQNTHKSYEVGLTASTTQTQGNGTLTANINEVSTVANSNDTITLQTAKQGLEVSIINNGDHRPGSGAQPTGRDHQ